MNRRDDERRGGRDIERALGNLHKAVHDDDESDGDIKQCCGDLAVPLCRARLFAVFQQIACAAQQDRKSTRLNSSHTS